MQGTERGYAAFQALGSNGRGRQLSQLLLRTDHKCCFAAARYSREGEWQRLRFVLRRLGQRCREFLELHPRLFACSPQDRLDSKGQVVLVVEIAVVSFAVGEGSDPSPVEPHHAALAELEKAGHVLVAFLLILLSQMEPRQLAERHGESQQVRLFRDGLCGQRLLVRVIPFWPLLALLGGDALRRKGPLAVDQSSAAFDERFKPAGHHLVKQFLTA